MAVDQGHRQIGSGTNTILDAVTKRHFLGTDRQYWAVNTVTNGAASGPAVAYPSLSLIQPSRRIGHPARTSQAGEPILMRRVSAPLAWLCMLVTLCAAGARPASAQQTTGIITGRIVDDQGAAVPGATVTGKNAATGFSRTDVSDGEGIFRLNALPVGTYDITTELQGFTKVENKGIVVNVGQTLDVNLTLKLATVQETITVNAETPLIQTSSSSVGGVVDINRIENLPLNGRQFANAAVTIPGVGLGFHSDPTKSTQYSPQIGGGNGRNVNYQIDGGDNNDDTVGGLLQLFPLEAIQEFNFVTQRYKAEYGRSNGGVMNIVTKSGTNDYHGSWFTNIRNTDLNAKTKTEKIGNLPKGEYERYQYGGSFGGPIMQNKAHFFAAYERTQQDTTQSVNTLGMFPAQDGAFPTPMRENLFTAKGSWNMTPTQYLSVRYGRNTNSQVYGATTRRVSDSWGDSVNTFNSFNINHNWVLSGAKLNEFVFQVADFANNVAARTGAPQETFPNGVTIGYNTNTPQTTEQRKYQFRDDFSWSASGLGGLGHSFKAGVNYIHEPRLFVTFSSGSTDYAYTHLDLDTAGKISAVTRNKPGASANLPMDQFGMYVQDDWRVTDRLTVNAGLRYDIVTGFDIDQSGIPNYNILTTSAQAGLFNGVPGFEEFGNSAGEDVNNIQPRIGAAYDLRGDGRDVIRGGWGIYYDFGYTNATILFPGLSAQGGSGTVFSITGKTAGILNADGTFFAVGQPIPNIASQNEVNPNGPFYGTQVTPPGIRQPWTSQLSAGWSHQLVVIDGLRRGLRSHRRHRPRRAVGTQHARQRRRSPLSEPGPEPGEPDVEHERRREQVRRRELQRSPAAQQGHLLQRVVLAGKRQGAWRPGHRRADDEPRPGLDQPVRRCAVGPIAADRRASQDLVERGRQHEVGYLRIADVPLPVGASPLHLDGL